MADTDSWAELADLYLSAQEFDDAAYCFEELILAEPDNYYYHVKYAEIKFSAGGKDNIIISKNHYAHSFELNSENNVRALYGILLCFHSLSKVGHKLTEEDHKLFQLAEEQLVKTYNTSGKNNELIEHTVDRLRTK